MTQDRNNELWLGTFGGISLFDGSNFINYSKSEGLPNNLILALTYGDDGNLWIGTSAGITRYDGYRFTTIGLPDITGEKIVFDIKLDKSGLVWARVNGRLYYLEQGRFVKDTSLDAVTALVQDKYGKIRASSFHGGIYKLNGKKWELETASGGIANMWQGKTSGKIYCLMANGSIMTAEGGEMEPPGWLPPLPFFNFYTQIFEDSKGNIWVNLTDGGAWMYRDKNWIHYTYHNGLTDDNVHSFFEDREGNVWIATNGSGIYRYSGNLFTYYDRSSGLASPSIMAIGESGKTGKLYLGTSSAGLYEINDRKPVKVNLNTGIENIICLQEDIKGRLWIGSEDAGIWMYDDRGGKKVQPDTGKPVLAAFAMHRQDSILWVSSLLGFCRISGDKIAYVDIPLRNIHAIMSIGADTLLLGTVQGAYIYHITSGRLEKEPLLPDANVLCFAKDDGNIYIGTDDRGVVRVNKSTMAVSLINRKQGLSCDYVYSLLKDKKGNLWVGTGCGIDRIAFGGEKIMVKSFGKSDGLLGIENNANASFEDKEGYLWFGTTKGAFRFNPYADPLANRAPVVVLQSVKLFSKEIPAGKYTDSITPFTHTPRNPVFPPGQNHLTFTFKGIYLSNPDKVRYRYQLIGADDAYTETDQSTVVYPNLPAGSYTFKVWASDADGNWYNNAVHYSFIIKAPFYKTVYFTVGLALLFIAIVLGSVYFRNRQKTLRMQWEERLREEEQARVRQRTAEDFHDEIGNKLTRINLLATIAESKLQAEAKDDIRGIIGQIQKNVSSLYNGSKDIIWSLQPYSDYLDEIVLRIRQNAAGMLEGTAIKFDYREQDGPENMHIRLPIDYSRNLIMIFKEAVNNIVKHSGAQNITLSVSWLDERIICLELSDDGNGFDENNIIKGNGLNNMRNRAARINAELAISSVPGSGSRLKLELPVV